MVNNLVDIGGKQRPVNFGRNALIEFEKLTGFKLLSGKTDFFDSHESYRAFVFAGLKWGLYNPEKGVEPKPLFTLFHVGDWIQDEPEAVAAVFKIFYLSMPTEKKSEGVEVENLPPQTSLPGNSSTV